MTNEAVRALVVGGQDAMRARIAEYLGKRGAGVCFQHTGAPDPAPGRFFQRSIIPLMADPRDVSKTPELIRRAAQALGGPVNCLVVTAMGLDDAVSVTSGLVQSFAAQVDAPQLDGSGELRASGSVVVLMQQSAPRVASGLTSFDMVRGTLEALIRSAALALAPQVRVNGIGLRPHPGGSIGERNAEVVASVGYLCDLPVLTGQILCLGEVPRAGRARTE